MSSVLVVIGYREAKRYEQILLQQLGVTAVVESNASKSQSEHQFHIKTVFSVVAEVELVVSDNGQIIQTTHCKTDFQAT